MAQEYKLTQEEVNTAQSLATSMILALMIKTAIGNHPDREVMAHSIEQGALDLISGQTPPEIPADRKAEFQRAAGDRASLIVRSALAMQKFEGPSQVQ